MKEIDLYKREWKDGNLFHIRILQRELKDAFLYLIFYQMMKLL